MTELVHNETVDTLLSRRSVRAFLDEEISPEITATLETAAQRAPSSMYLNDWSAIRVTDPELKAKLAAIGGQPYIATAPLLYVFVVDQYRNAMIAQQNGVDIHSEEFTLDSNYRFVEAMKDATLALHAMETAANSLDLGCVVLGSILANVPELISLLDLPEYTYPVLGLAIGKPAAKPELKPRFPREDQFFENRYQRDPKELLHGFAEFDDLVHNYYDQRNTAHPLPKYSVQIVNKATAENVRDTNFDSAREQGFKIK